ncbi:alpha/beta hydrolase [Rhodococcus pyridinivorans]|uniref:alpha/beta hydrolase n=1 Tax=Rhodococcus pyridinivorans TaxID=103816 RepID=UPI00200B704D|nr:alpha/beta hydrolase [Rhodococcus pyridinivorans]UPW04051.1 alpha/beta hydrolase [Rhodococcus pyridinivorans]
MSVARTELLPLPTHHATTREFAGVSTRSRALSFSVRRTVRPFIEAWSYAPTLPWPASAIDHLAFPLVPVPGTHRRRVDLPMCPAELLWAQGAAPPAAQVGMDGTAVLYLHGGAFLCCGLTTHRHLVSRISATTGAPVLAVGYRMLPRHPIRRAVEDGLDGLRWLVAHGHPAERVVIAGDSAGGFLTFAVAHEAVRLGIGRPAGTVALSPLTDLDPRGKLDHPNSHRCAVFPRRAVAVLSTLVERAERLGGEGAEPVASPVDLDLSEMPPALIQTGSEEMTYVDAELMARRLQLAGVSAELQVWEKQVHAFQAAAGVVPESSRAIAEIGRFVRELR